MLLFRHCTTRITLIGTTTAASLLASTFHGVVSLQLPHFYHTTTSVLLKCGTTSFVTSNASYHHCNQSSNNRTTQKSNSLISLASSNMSSTGGGGGGVCSSSHNLTIVQIPCLNDNYGYLVHDATTGQTAAIDTPEAGPYQQELNRRGWTLTHIWNTHHHWDHVGGNLQLKEQYNNVQIVGPSTETIPGIDIPVKGGDSVQFGSTKAHVIDVGGHTKGHIAYYFANEAKVFVGDSLFALGCGKMFEGTPSQFWASLKRLRDLPDETEVFCAHEYTLSNAKFAVSVEPGNAELVARVTKITELRQHGKPTVPSLLGVEKRTNPFLRCDLSEELRHNVGVVEGDSDDIAFAKTRKAKDNF